MTPQKPAKLGVRLPPGWSEGRMASGEVAERLNAAVSKTVVRFRAYPGFESLPLRHRYEIALMKASWPLV